MTDDFDAVVVGARAAGASTAMLLARLGHRVALVDRATMPSDTISTHALLRPGVLQLRRWGLLERLDDAGTPRVRELTLGFGDERVRTAVREEHGVPHLYAPRRYLLDGVLVEAAAAAGVEVIDETTVTEVCRSDRRVSGVRARHRDRNLVLTAQVVVGADGVRSRIARSVGAATIRWHAPTNAVHYAYFSGIEHPGFWFQFTDGINAGLIATNEGLRCAFVGRHIDEYSHWAGRPDDAFRGLLERAGSDLADAVSAGRRESPFRGTSGLPSQTRQAWGPGWALVGDASCTIDPISAHGISSALRDAELCALAIDRWLRNPPCEPDAMAAYQSLRDDLSTPILDAARELAGYGWTARRASSLMRSISEVVRVECEHLVNLPPIATRQVLPADST